MQATQIPTRWQARLRLTPVSFSWFPLTAECIGDGTRACRILSTGTYGTRGELDCLALR